MNEEDVPSSPDIGELEGGEVDRGDKTGEEVKARAGGCPKTAKASAIQPCCPLGKGDQDQRQEKTDPDIGEFSAQKTGVVALEVEIVEEDQRRCKDGIRVDQEIGGNNGITCRGKRESGSRRGGIR